MGRVCVESHGAQRRLETKSLEAPGGTGSFQLSVVTRVASPGQLLRCGMRG